MKLSYSSISTYQTCPLKYRFRYVEERPPLPSPALSFGQSIHEALRWFYSVPTPHPCSVAELVDYLDSCWVSEGYSSPEEEAKYFFQAKSTLQMFYRNNVHSFRLPAALEYRFKIDTGSFELSGVIDRLDKHPDDGFEIIDYKTNRRLPPAWKLEKDLQLPIYHIACENIWDVSPRKVTFYYLLINHRHSLQVTESRKREALLEIERVANCISNGEFEPCTNNLCPWCDYTDICPSFFGERKTAADAGPSLDIGQMVDELIATHDQAMRKLSRVEDLKKMVSTYLDEKGIDRVGGSKGVAFRGEDGSLSWKDTEGQYQESGGCESP